MNSRSVTLGQITVCDFIFTCFPKTFCTKFLPLKQQTSVAGNDAAKETGDVYSFSCFEFLFPSEIK